MGLYYITFRSVTYAQRGEKLLSRQNLRVSLMRTPRWMEEQGCGYSLRVRYTEAARCAQLLRQETIPYRKAYLFLENGTYEELDL